jgi:hypothetical protein
VKRERPADGGIVWHDRLNAFECLGCGEFEAVGNRRLREDPEWLARHKELLVLDHTECWEFDDPKMARDARRYRTAKKRRKLLKSRAGAALDRQSVSWRGR